MTVNQIVTKALRKLSVLDEGESANYNQVSDGIDALNDLLSLWSVQGWSVYSSTVVSKTLTKSDGEYSIGTGGDIDTTRPVWVKSAYVRRSGIDYNLTIKSTETLDARSDKDIEGIPAELIYQGTYPTGTINIYPLPENSTDVLYLRVYQAITEFSAGSDEIALPPEYRPALFYNLIVELAPEFNREPPASMVARAIESNKALKRLHARNRIPILNTKIFENTVTKGGRVYGTSDMSGAMTWEDGSVLSWE